MITVRLHGPLRGPITEPICIAASTVAEAIEAVSRQLPHLAPTALGPKRARVVGFDTPDSLYKHQTEDLTIDVVPAVFFSGSAEAQIIVGTLLVVTAAFMGGVFWPAIIGSMGVSLMMGGIMQLIAPQAKLSNDEENRSRYLGSPPNTVGIGTRIPILYGEDLVQGHIISSDIDAAEVI